jgi:hypothetical protein
MRVANKVIDATRKKKKYRTRDLSFNLFPVGSHVVEHFEVH